MGPFSSKTKPIEEYRKVLSCSHVWGGPSPQLKLLTHEQREIGNYLDAKSVEIDSLIEARQSMAEKLREYRKSLISEAVTGKFKVPGVK